MLLELESETAPADGELTDEAATEAKSTSQESDEVEFSAGENPQAEISEEEEPQGEATEGESAEEDLSGDSPHDPQKLSEEEGEDLDQLLDELMDPTPSSVSNEADDQSEGADPTAPQDVDTLLAGLFGEEESANPQAGGKNGGSADSAPAESADSGQELDALAQEFEQLDKEPHKLIQEERKRKPSRTGNYDEREATFLDKLTDLPARKRKKRSRQRGQPEEKDRSYDDAEEAFLAKVCGEEDETGETRTPRKSTAKPKAKPKEQQSTSLKQARPTHENPTTLPTNRLCGAALLKEVTTLRPQRKDGLLNLLFRRMRG